jgi:8-oxo-dGTP pyrophosphatase MutT (NUDIX family)
MAPKAPPASLSSFTAAPTLSPFNILVKDYLTSNPSKHHIISGALVFSPSNQLLLLQRSAADYMPNLWEIPGGSCEHDETILEGTVRELWEESGLVATELVRQVGGTYGSTQEWVDGEKVWCKFSFEVKVDGLDINLDEDEHQNWLWVSEEECRIGVVVREGKGTEIEFTSDGQLKAILEGFRLIKEG